MKINISVWFQKSKRMVFCIFGVLILLGVLYVMRLFIPYADTLAETVIGDYLSICVAINMGLTFEYVRDAIGKPLQDKIDNIQHAVIAQLQDKGIEHKNIDADLDKIKKSNKDQVNDCSRFIRKIAWGWSAICIIEIMFGNFSFVKNAGICNLIYLYPAFYFLCCLWRHQQRIMTQINKRVHTCPNNFPHGVIF